MPSNPDTTKTYMHPGPNCDSSGHLTCPYSQWAETEIGRLRGAIAEHRRQIMGNGGIKTNRELWSILDGTKEVTHAD